MAIVLLFLKVKYLKDYCNYELRKEIQRGFGKSKRF